MKRKRDGLVLIGEVVGEPDGPVTATRRASPQARHHFTLDRLVTASEAVARLLTLCSLPRTNPGGATR